jgi:hypothetical protein
MVLPLDRHMKKEEFSRLRMMTVLNTAFTSAWSILDRSEFGLYRGASSPSDKAFLYFKFTQERPEHGVLKNTSRDNRSCCNIAYKEERQACSNLETLADCMLLVLWDCEAPSS